MATRENEENGIVIAGTSKADEIFNYGSKVTISSGKGNDEIYNEGGSNVSINAGSGSNSIYNWGGDNVKIVSGAGNDFVENFGDNVTISSGKGNDYIQNDGSNVLIKYTGGNDTIEGLFESNTLMISSGKLDTVIATNSVDYFLKVGENIITLKDVAWFDTINIVNSKGKAIKFTVAPPNIIGTDGDDELYNYADDATISGGAGNDSIYSYGSKVSIDAGTGNDYIYSEGYRNKFIYSGGNDTISGFNWNDTLQIASGKLNTVINSDGYNYFLTVGKNKITLNGGANPGSLDKLTIVNAKNEEIKYRVKANIVGTKGKDTLTNYASGAVIRALGGNDSIHSYGSNVSIDGGAGNDSIYSEGDNVSINGGSGNDSIYSEGNDNVLIFGGEGNDKIYNIDIDSDNVTIDGGSGNDTIDSDGNNVLIFGGEGNDVIYSDGSNVSIDGGAGNDKIYNYYGDNVSMSGGAGYDSLWGDSDGEYKDIFIYAKGDGNDIIYNFDNNDLLKITGTFSASYNTSKKELYFKVDSTSNAITLKNFMAKTFHINDAAYKISGTTLKKK